MMDAPASSSSSNSNESVSNKAFRKQLIRRNSTGPKQREETMAHFDCLERPLSLFFYKYGKFVARHPLPFIIIPILLTALMSVGFFFKTEVTDATYLFTPTRAPSKMERRAIHEKWPLYDGNYVPGRSVTQARESQLIIMSRNESNILETGYAQAVDRLNKFITTRIHVQYKGMDYYYNDLCLTWRDEGCHTNAQAGLVSNLYNSGANISFPMYKFGSKNIYLASSLGGVRLRRSSDGTESIASASAWMFVYHLKFNPDNISYISGLWEREFERQMLVYKDPFITITFFHSQTLSAELKRNAETLVPRFAISYAILTLFSILCSISFVRGRWVIDWVLSKPWLAVAGVLNAGMGVASAIGLLNFCGVIYNDIVSVMPFLVVSIGVDNMFLMMAAMRRTNRALPNDKRVAESLSDSAISISITAITDGLSFGVGAITTIPAVEIFCIYTCVAIIMTFLYQLTFFLALLVLHGQAEEHWRHAYIFTRTSSPEQADLMGWNRRLFFMGTRPDPNPRNARKNFTSSAMGDFFRDWYGPVLMQPIVRALVLVWLALYLGFAVWGCTKLREGLEPINLLVQDSYAIPHYHALEKYFWKYGTEVQVVINNAPMLNNSVERDRVRAVVDAFANTEHTIGSNGVQFWLNDFQYFINQEVLLPRENLDSGFYRFIHHFTNLATYNKWSQDIYWDPLNPAMVKSFRFTVGMKNFEKTIQQRETTSLMREVASRYPDYNITTFMPLWLFTDQYMLVLPNTIQNIAIALICMLFIAIMLIPHPLCSLWVALAIASIDVGVIGYMTLWDVNLDAISMITIIMSIGFSVDFSAHITYGYVISDEPEPTDKVRMALGALGWPIMQGAASTIFGVLVLSTVPAYMIVTFFKTVFLVIIIGCVHGLVFLPVLLSIFVRGQCTSRNKPKVAPAKDSAKKSSTKDKPKDMPPVNQAAASRMYIDSPTSHMDVDSDFYDDHPHLYGPAGRYGIFLPRINHLQQYSSGEMHSPQLSQRSAHPPMGNGHTPTGNGHAGAGNGHLPAGHLRTPGAVQVMPPFLNSPGMAASSGYYKQADGTIFTLDGHKSLAMRHANQYNPALPAVTVLMPSPLTQYGHPPPPPPKYHN